METHKPESQKVDFDSIPPMKIPSDLPSNSKLSFKFDTFLWLILSAVTLYYSDLINVLKTHSLTNETPFALAVWSGGISVAIALYLVVWCSYVKGVNSDDWESYNPFAIPFATGCGVLSGVSWNISLWSVYGIKTPFITLILFMGIVMIVSILPSWSSVGRNNSKQPLNNSKWMKAHGKME